MVFENILRLKTLNDQDDNGLLRDFRQELEGVEQSLEQVRGLLEKARQADEDDARLRYESELEKLQTTRERIRKKIDDYQRDIDKLSDT